IGDTQSTRAATSRIQGTIVSLIRNPGRSRDTKSSRAANPSRSRHTKSSRAANPGTHGPRVPETREANVKCTDRSENKLDVRRHRCAAETLYRSKFAIVTVMPLRLF
ncbi:hypothetical protein Prudu_009902, partial [Prunus dulcis]